MRYTDNLENMIDHIRKQKGVSYREMSKRLGIALKDYYKMSRHIGIKTLTRMCNALGVELCIIDGWRKYRINDVTSLPEIEIMFNEMNKMPNVDLYEEAKDEERKRGEWRREYLKTYCRGCKWCDVTKEQEKGYWCGYWQRYTMKEGCKVERDIPKIFRE